MNINNIVKYLNKNPKGNIKDFPKEIKEYFMDSMENIFDFYGDINDIKEGTILQDFSFDYEYIVKNIIIGSGVTSITTINDDILFLSLTKSNRNRKLKIKN